MADVVDRQVARMMKWRARALIPVAALLCLDLIRMADEWMWGPSTHLRMLALLPLLPAAVLVPILYWEVFRTGKWAFGVRSGWGYLVLAVLLTPLFGIGIFVVPDMIRTDIKRLLDADID